MTTRRRRKRWYQRYRLIRTDRKSVALWQWVFIQSFASFGIRRFLQDVLPPTKPRDRDPIKDLASVIARRQRQAERKAHPSV